MSRQSDSKETALGHAGEEFGLNGLDLRLEFLNLVNDEVKLLSGARRPP